MTATNRLPNGDNIQVYSISPATQLLQPTAQLIWAHVQLYMASSISLETLKRMLENFQEQDIQKTQLEALCCRIFNNFPKTSPLYTVAAEILALGIDQLRLNDSAAGTAILQRVEKYYVGSRRNHLLQSIKKNIAGAKTPCGIKGLPFARLLEIARSN